MDRMDVLRLFLIPLRIKHWFGWESYIQALILSIAAITYVLYVLKSKDSFVMKAVILVVGYPLAVYLTNLVTFSFFLR